MPSLPRGSAADATPVRIPVAAKALMLGAGGLRDDSGRLVVRLVEHGDGTCSMTFRLLR